MCIPLYRNAPGTPLGGPPSYKCGIGSEGPGASPASIAPSPLATPRSQPSSVSQPEPPMPTLSPQPSSSEKLPVQTPENTGPKSVSSLSNQVYSAIKSYLFNSEIDVHITYMITFYFVSRYFLRRL